MKQNTDDNFDPITGEVNPTSLAEDAVWNSGFFDNDSVLDDPEHWIWDLAAEVVEEEQELWRAYGRQR